MRVWPAVAWKPPAAPGWTPLVGGSRKSGCCGSAGRRSRTGVGQVVLLSGEAGIGKSRLVQVLKEHVAAEPQAWLTPCQCSPYHQHTALYPMIDLLERVALRFEREESPPAEAQQTGGFLVQYGLPLAEAVPLFAALLSLPLPADYAPLTLSPEQQKQQTLHALLTILLRIAAQQPVLFVMEDLHWVDPSTLELLSLLVDQGPTARILALLTFRPDFSPPWTGWRTMPCGARCGTKPLPTAVRQARQGIWHARPVGRRWRASSKRSWPWSIFPESRERQEQAIDVRFGLHPAPQDAVRV